jgi:uncharacterized protein YegP (UPF0339 family)
MTKTHVFQIYRDASREWRWRLVARNGKTIADSAESYKTGSGAYRAAERTKKAAGDAVIEVKRAK